MPGGLRTDLYELNMVASYLCRSMTGQATFSLFVRKLPLGCGFLIAAGLERAMARPSPAQAGSGHAAGTAEPPARSRDVAPRAGAGIAAVVSRGGRPDLARPRLAAVTVPTLLIAGRQDEVVLGRRVAGHRAVVKC